MRFSMTKIFARILGPDNIAVNAVVPAFANTSMVANWMTEDDFADVPSARPIGRMAGAEEITMPAAFLASNSATTITDRTLNINK